MHLKEYSSFFQPEEFDAMTSAYDAAWQHVRKGQPGLTSDQAKVLKKNLAQIILASACNGNRGAGRLKEIALRGVSGRLLHRLLILSPQFLPATLFSG
jgi:hypothetical protein